MNTSNYMHAIPNSHFWTDLDQIIGFVQRASLNESFVNDLLIGLHNCKLHGYDLQKATAEKLNWIDKWLELFPEGVKNAGKKIRGDRDICESKMMKFIVKYGYDPATIMKATISYLDERSLHNYAYTMLSNNFISHREKGSLLAEKCKEVIEERSKETFTFERNELI